MRIPRTLSPYMLIQEFLRDEPWKLLVACIMLNQTRARQVHGVINEFFDRYPNPKALLEGDPEEIKELIRPLGFMNRRADRLVAMSENFLSWDGGNPRTLHGIGKYGADSYQIFCMGIIVEDVEDKELQNYVRWALSSTIEDDHKNSTTKNTSRQPGQVLPVHL